MEARALKSNDRFCEFDPDKRERTEGVFLVYRRGEKNILFVDESGKMFHLAFRVAVKKAFGLTENDIVGAGRYHFRETRFMHSDKLWSVSVERGAYKDLSVELFDEVARKICNGEAWMRE